MGVIRLTPNCSVTRENVYAVLSCEPNVVQKQKRQFNEAGRLLDMTRGKRGRTLVILRSGGPYDAVLLDVKNETIDKRITDHDNAAPPRRRQQRPAQRDQADDWGDDQEPADQ